MKQFKYFLDNKLKQANAYKSNIDTVAICKLSVKDQDYFDFISFIENGGFFFGQSLQIYDHSNSHGFNNIIVVNSMFKKEFNFLFKDVFSFGQDIFGNQFVFDEHNGEVSLFNIESGQIDRLAKNFAEWMDVFVADVEYLTGRIYEQEWKADHEFPFDSRLQPKLPFVMGGDYSVSNFYINSYPSYISYNADMAKQIYNLKDGEKIKLNIKY
ncbi:SMI1/KNR4 family protein [Chitinophaga sp. S165]|uniref:SMI1/KNR4 family protein n=1 Tax=Chitinophaga sp. S165 TaxID=2135462 RepID=UPI000D71022B|nr:SMI1/KNR4 family protein [Chitinophaga sp. S165]PWV56389.1 hypothetical protein C7475_101904 [Chitinophaga sp. S165]